MWTSTPSGRYPGGSSGNLLTRCYSSSLVTQTNYSACSSFGVCTRLVSIAAVVISLFANTPPRTADITSRIYRRSAKHKKTAAAMDTSRVLAPNVEHTE